MDILNTGSFVPLENREKIEQLKFTAKELASEAAKTDGFQNNGPTNQQLALEVWKVAEYMCRAHEKTTVRNIFLSSFLEKLRELARSAPSPYRSQSVPTPPSNAPSLTPVAEAATGSLPTVPSEPEQSAHAAAVATDEFLGVIPSIEDAPPEKTQSSYADECVPGYDADIEAIVDRLDNEASNQDTRGCSEPIAAGSKETAIAGNENIASEGSETDIPPPTDQTAVDELIQERVEAEATEPSGSPGSESIESIVIAEKEPYNFDSCTITAVVQILPASTGTRKCVVSVRSHDFVPRITISDLANGRIAEDIGRSLETAFEQYRTSLPVLAAEKIKKDKPAAKKRSAKPAEKAKTMNTSAEPQSAAPAQTAQNSEAAQGQNTLFAS